ncbi:MAG: hypothetical protein ACYC0C_07110 [Devosia sp.]
MNKHLLTSRPKIRRDILRDYARIFSLRRRGANIALHATVMPRESQKMKPAIVRYSEAAELYLGRDPKVARGLGFKRFETAAAAIRFAVEDVSPMSLRGASLEVGDVRYSGPEIAALYADDAYPLTRKPASAEIRSNAPKAA